LNEISGSLLLAVNQSVAPRSLVLAEGDEVAFLPPVSGGEGSDFCRITPEEISAVALVEGMKGPGDGAVVTFEGIVRDNSSGRKTLYLEYEAYTPMAAREMEAIAREAKRKFSVSGVRITHRTGRLAIGETSVAIAVTSAHRAAAFEACRYAIDQLKRRVPIWKKEYFADGAAWAGGEGLSNVLGDPHRASALAPAEPAPSKAR
ncbi:MAG: molybdenum cofactor biosynthesis protein MoaE, partial [Acidobacteriota bacterium]|nr:molybdenum cofactor biosynthesis protein MoaE [Acidobacteriota bacterium]